jgi:hypothetical protein
MSVSIHKLEYIILKIFPPDNSFSNNFSNITYDIIQKQIITEADIR